MRITRRLAEMALATTVLVACVATVAAQTPPDADAGYVRAHYTKFEYRVPMRDGARLFTSVYAPKTCEAPHPILLKRTPYSVWPYGVDQYPERIGPSEHLMKADYIVVYQDVRGQHMSEGTWVDLRPTRPSSRTGARPTRAPTPGTASSGW